MPLNSSDRNPFTVLTPEGMLAREAVDLFVDVFTDFPKIPRDGHLFLHGPRGSGKSMMFRYLQPDCQCLVKDCNLTDLPFYAIHIPIKNSGFAIAEIQRLEHIHSSALINEHFMITHTVEKFFESLLNVIPSDIGKCPSPETKDFCQDYFIPLIKMCGGKTPTIKKRGMVTANDIIIYMKDLSGFYHQQISTYIKKLSFHPKAIAYTGPLFSYLDYLYKLLSEIRKLSYFHKGTFYLMFDDADFLSLTQTKILNTWVSTRTITNVSIKVSTQMRYKTYHTLSGYLIECPHDYTEANISTIYTTSKKSRYRNRVCEIVTRRLKLRGYNQSPSDFFPCDINQERKIRKIAQEYQTKWKTDPRGFRPDDDAYRYARPDYIKSLGGKRKSRHTYRYAGFDQLIHISSGVVRDFLEAAATMFSVQLSRNPGKKVTNIPVTVQDEVIRTFADELMLNEFEKLRSDQEGGFPHTHDIEKLHNLIIALGQTFNKILMSNRSERRVFSIAISGKLDDEVRNVLKLGTERSFFHASSIGNKEGTGRTELFVLTRRLAPHFHLDPSGFAGYLFVTSDALRLAMNNPNFLLRKFEEGKQEDFEIKQLRLFE